ncbi:uncharacterized protein LOC116016216 [Ipomoea triloba]|uniref:uncharacterized protein LOC116016216 n=1 Tax=Ipomoea triloba TaxID=35885 RepID=UPI00125E8FF3|nr:uncharacterized protein LOC116016216 [Ipomoea triloba]
MENHQQNPKKRDREEEDDGFSRKKDFPPPLTAAAAGEGNLKVKLRIGKSPPVAGEEESPEKKDHVCVECNKRFSSGKALGGHMSSAHVQANRDYSYKKKKQVVRGGAGGSSKGSDEDGGEEEDEEEGRREYYRGKDGEIRCPHCFKKFPSRKSLFGHMRCHPDRYWRGMEPPPIPGSSTNKSEDKDEDEDEDKDKDGKISPERVDLQGYLSSWGSKAKRGRSPIKQRSSSTSISDDEELQEAVHHLVCLGNAQNPNPEINKNNHMIGKGKEKLIDEEDGLDNHSEDDEDHGITKWINPKNIDCPNPNGNASAAALSNDNNKKRRIIVENTMRPLMESEMELTKELFKCSTCNKCFSSHQALGGHRSSHNKFRLSVQNTIDDEQTNTTSAPATIPVPSPVQNPQTVANTNENINDVPNATSKYQCGVCNKVFATGKALGGHKKCHSVSQSTLLQPAPPLSSPERSSTPPDDDATGKALGGHKKCHSVSQSTLLQPVPPNSPERSSNPPDDDDDDDEEPKRLDFDLNEIPDDE